MPPTQVYSYRALSTSSSTLSPTTLNILKCNFSLACCWSYILCSKLGLGLAASARFRTNYNSFWFSVSLQMQKCKMASRPLSQDGMDGMVWYGIRWDGMSVCLLIDDRCGRRWSSFVYRLRRTCVSAFDPRTSPLGSIHLLLEQLHSQIGANAFEFVWPAAKSIDNQSAPVQFGQPSCQFAQSAQVHSKKLFIYSNFNMKCQLVWNDRELTHIILIYYTHFKKIVFLKDYFCKGILLKNDSNITNYVKEFAIDIWLFLEKCF